MNWTKFAAAMAPLNPYGVFFGPDGGIYGPDGTQLVPPTDLARPAPATRKPQEPRATRRRRPAPSRALTVA
jgi:hypothetical protein